MTAGSYPDLEREARLLGRYLIGEEINEAAIHLYIRAHSHHSFELDAREVRLLKWIHRHPGLAGMVDGGLALQKRDSTIRKKIFFMLAILETFPEYSRHYLFPDPVSGRAAWNFLVSGARGVIRMALGSFLVRLA